MVSLHRYSVVVGLSSRAGLGSVRSVFPIRRSDNQLLSFGRMVFFKQIPQNGRSARREAPGSRSFDETKRIKSV